MEITQRWLITLTVVATIAMGVCRLDSDAAANFLEDTRKVVHHLRVLQAGHGRRATLNSQHEQVVAVAKMKQVLAEVLENRLSIKEAAARFATTDYRVHYDWDYLKITHPEMTLETRCGYYVVETINYMIQEERSDSELVAKYRAVVRSWHEQ